MSTTGFSLSPQQRHLWTRLQSGDGSGLNAVTHVTLRGQLDADLLGKALGLVVQKYEILRTSVLVSTDGGTAVQVIQEYAPVELQYRDVSDLASEQQADALHDLLDQAARTRFQLDSGPVLATWLLRRDVEHHDLLMALPALCADEAGLTNLVAEVAAAWVSLTGGEAFDGEAMQYTDIAEWQNELLTSEESRPGLAFWRERLDAKGAAIQLPFQRPRSRHFAPEVLATTIDGELAASVTRLATQLELTPREVLLGAWVTLLRRLGGSDEVLLGLGLDGRQYDELVEPLGLLSRTLPLPLQLDLEQPFEALLGQLAGEARDMQRWQECYGTRVASSAVAADQPAFAYQYLPALPGHTVGATQLTIEAQSVSTEVCACRLVCREQEGGWLAGFRYDSTAFERATVERLAGQWLALLTDAVQSPQTPLGRLDVLSAAERQSLLIDFNATDAEYSRDVCAHHWIEAHAAATPDAVAVRQGEAVLTYAELDAWANQLAHHLQSLGVGPDTMVALCIDRSLEMVVAIVGILKAGGAYVPIDPAYPKERVQFLVEDTRAPVLVTQERLLDEFGSAGAQLVSMDSHREAIAAWPSTRPESRVTPGNLVYVIYTSGSTGKPKGVVITHEKLVISNEARVHAFGHTPRSFLLLSSVAFDSSVVGIFWSLCGGGSLLLMPQGLEKDIAAIPEYIAEHGVSHLLTLPSFYRLILEQSDAAQLSSLTTAIVAGEACPLKMVEHHRRVLPGVGLFSEYGATETTVFSSVYDCLTQTEQIAPLGDPVLNIQMYILDEHLDACPIGVPGEVHFGGTALAPPVQVGRQGPLPRERRDGVPRSPRQPGQDPRLPGRARGDRGRPGRTLGAQGGRRAGPGRPGRREAPGGLPAGRGRQHPAVSQRVARLPRREPARVHAAGGVRVLAGDAAHAERQGRSQSPARARLRASRSAERLRGPRVRRREDPGGHLGRRARHRSRGHP